MILPDDCSSEIRMEDRAYMRSLVESMPRRLQEVVNKASNTTNYLAEDQYTKISASSAKNI